MTAAKQATILIVDDDRVNVKVLEAFVKAEGHATRTANGGEAALDLVAAELPDLVLLDAMMPGIDGFQVVTRLKADPRTAHIPIIMITGLNDRDSRLRALQVGAEEFLNKPVDRMELRVRVRNLLRLKEYGDFLENYNHILEREVESRTAELRESYRETIITMTRAAEYKDQNTGAHVRRISFYSLELAERMGLDSKFADAFFFASPMHDIGKIGIPDNILLKPASLDAEEYGIMRTHCMLGARILGKNDSPYIRMGAEIALTHHERWDGSGYPNGLMGEEIPLSARLMAVCDVYDALRTERPYKPALDHETAVAIMTRGDGRTMPEHFDPAVLATFQSSGDTFQQIYAAHTDPPQETES